MLLSSKTPVQTVTSQGRTGVAIYFGCPAQEKVTPVRTVPVMSRPLHSGARLRSLRIQIPRQKPDTPNIDPVRDVPGLLG